MSQRHLAPRLAALVLLAFLCSSGLTGAPVQAEEAGGASFTERVNQAIKEGSNWLLAKPKLFTANKFPAATWGLIGADSTYDGKKGATQSAPAGPTALSLYTLLKCGVDPAHPVIERGFNWLREVHGISKEHDGRSLNGASWQLYKWADSYELSTIILALTAKYDPHKKTAKSMEQARKGKLKIKGKRDRKWLNEMVDLLVLRRRNPGAEDRLGWRYNRPSGKIGRWNFPEGVAPADGAEDLSSTQLAALALFNANRFGAKARVDVWKNIVIFTLQQQQKSGPEHQRFDPIQPDKAPVDKARGFCYMSTSSKSHEKEPTGAMTACGVANLLMAREILTHHKKTSRSWPKSDEAKRVEKAINDGIAWLDLNWSTSRNPKSGKYHIYYLYALERAMDLLDKRLVGKNLWYEEGAEEILKRQSRSKVSITEKKGKREAPGTHWNTKSTHRPYDVLDTCFALLFLKRATRGVVPAITGG